MSDEKTFEELKQIAYSDEHNLATYRLALQLAVEKIEAQHKADISKLSDLPDEIIEGKAYDEVKELLRDFYGYKKFDDNLTINLIETVAPHIVAWTVKEISE